MLPIFIDFCECFAIEADMRTLHDLLFERWVVDDIVETKLNLFEVGEQSG